MKEAYYFSHDANARRDPKVLKMLSKHKYGYQWYFMIIEILREQSDYRYKIDAYCWNAIAMELHEQPETIENFVQDCIEEFGLFQTDNDSFWSESLLGRMRQKEEKSEKYRENSKKRWGKDAMAMQSQSNGNALKERKVKESKVKEIEDKDIVSVQEVWNSFAVKHNLAQIMKLTDSRIKSIRQRKQEEEFDLVKILGLIAESDFLKGNNNNNWKVDFDFVFCSKNNYLKILEGKYNGKVKTAGIYQQHITEDKLRGIAEDIYNDPDLIR